LHEQLLLSYVLRHIGMLQSRLAALVVFGPGDHPQNKLRSMSPASSDTRKKGLALHASKVDVKAYAKKFTSLAQLISNISDATDKLVEEQCVSHNISKSQCLMLLASG
jgi:hypothetical protein